MSQPLVIKFQGESSLSVVEMARVLTNTQKLATQAVQFLYGKEYDIVLAVEPPKEGSFEIDFLFGELKHRIRETSDALIEGGQLVWKTIEEGQYPEIVENLKKIQSSGEGTKVAMDQSFLLPLFVGSIISNIVLANKVGNNFKTGNNSPLVAHFINHSPNAQQIVNEITKPAIQRKSPMTIGDEELPSEDIKSLDIKLSEMQKSIFSQNDNVHHKALLITDYYQAQKPENAWSFIYEGKSISMGFSDPSDRDSLLEYCNNNGFFKKGDFIVADVMYTPTARVHHKITKIYSENGFVVRNASNTSQELKKAFDEGLNSEE
jgi:hypothetical protein